MQKFFVKQGDVWPDKGKLMTVQEVLDVFFKGSQIDQGEIDSELKVKKSLKGISTANIDEHLSLLMKIDDGINQEFEKNSQISEIIKILQLVKDLSSKFKCDKRIEISSDVAYRITHSRAAKTF